MLRFATALLGALAAALALVETPPALAADTYLVTSAPFVSQGAAASVVAGAPVGQMRITGVTGMSAGDVGSVLSISGAASVRLNGNFQIVAVNGATSVDVANAAVVASDPDFPDAGNGAIAWSLKKGATVLKNGAALAGSPFARDGVAVDAAIASAVDGDRIELTQVDPSAPFIYPFGQLSQINKSLAIVGVGQTKVYGGVVTFDLRAATDKSVEIRNLWFENNQIAADNDGVYFGQNTIRGRNGRPRRRVLGARESTGAELAKLPANGRA